jgi:cytochrome c peroxidase
MAWQQFCHWDGGVSSLNKQAINPLTHAKEMDNRLDEVLLRLNQSSFYRNRFTVLLAIVSLKQHLY